MNLRLCLSTLRKGFAFPVRCPISEARLCVGKPGNVFWVRKLGDRNCEPTNRSRIIDWHFAIRSSDIGCTPGPP